MRYGGEMRTFPPCSTCQAWKSSFTEDPPGEVWMGECRRRAPAVMYTRTEDPRDGYGRGQWPVTHAQEGCLEHVPGWSGSGYSPAWPGVAWEGPALGWRSPTAEGSER